MFIDYLCCVPQCCLLVSATSTGNIFVRVGSSICFGLAGPTCARTSGLAARKGVAKKAVPIAATNAPTKKH